MSDARSTEIRTADGVMGAHVTLPSRPRGTGIVLVHEIFGVNDYITAVADRLAATGHVVVSPDLFWRIDPDRPLDHSDEALGIAFERVGRLDFPAAVADSVEALGFTRALPEVDRGVAVMGFCLGGTVAFAAGIEGDPEAIVSYYGSGVADHLPRAAELTCPAMFVFGTHDPFIPNEVADAVEQTFTERADVSVHRFAAGHAFDNFLAPQFHDAGAAITAWGITTDFLARSIGR